MLPESRGRLRRAADIAVPLLVGAFLVLVVLGWLAVFLGGAWVVFKRRDA